MEYMEEYCGDEGPLVIGEEEGQEFEEDYYYAEEEEGYYNYEEQDEEEGFYGSFPQQGQGQQGQQGQEMEEYYDEEANLVYCNIPPTDTNTPPEEGEEDIFQEIKEEIEEEEAGPSTHDNNFKKSPKVKVTTPPQVTKRSKRKQKIQPIKTDEEDGLLTAEEFWTQENKRRGFTPGDDNSPAPGSSTTATTHLYMLDPLDFPDDPIKQQQIRKAKVTHRHHEKKNEAIRKLKGENDRLQGVIQFYQNRDERLKRACFCSGVRKILGVTATPTSTPTVSVIAPSSSSSNSSGDGDNDNDRDRDSGPSPPEDFELMERAIQIEKSRKISTKKGGDGTGTPPPDPVPNNWGNKTRIRTPEEILEKALDEIVAYNNNGGTDTPPPGRKWWEEYSKGFKALLNQMRDTKSRSNNGVKKEVPQFSSLLSSEALPLSPSPISTPTPSSSKVKAEVKEPLGPPSSSAPPRKRKPAVAEKQMPKLLNSPVMRPLSQSLSQQQKKGPLPPPPPLKQSPQPPKVNPKVRPVKVKCPDRDPLRKLKKPTPPSNLLSNTLQRLGKIDLQVSDEILKYWGDEVRPLPKVNPPLPPRKVIKVTIKEVLPPTPPAPTPPPPEDKISPGRRSKRSAAISRPSTADLLSGRGRERETTVTNGTTATISNNGGPDPTATPPVPPPVPTTPPGKTTLTAYKRVGKNAMTWKEIDVDKCDWDQLDLQYLNPRQVCEKYDF